MQFVTIPFDYDELPEASRAPIIPICVARNDEQGRPIAWGWFEAVARIPDRMLGLARRYLRDPWRASELSEEAVHRVWRTHGSNFGRHPEGRLYANAAWLAKDLRAGSWQERRGIVTGLDDLEDVVHNRILVDPANYVRRYQGHLDYRALSERLVEEGLEDVSQMLDLLRDGATWDEIGERMGRHGDAARMRFHRKTAWMLSGQSRR
jgi:DNA-directed RNA polymerase specialized sigma24 family protein